MRTLSILNHSELERAFPCLLLNANSTVKFNRLLSPLTVQSQGKIEKNKVAGSWYSAVGRSVCEQKTNTRHEKEHLEKKKDECVKFDVQLCEAQQRKLWDMGDQDEKRADSWEMLDGSD